MDDKVLVNAKESSFSANTATKFAAFVAAAKLDGLKVYVGPPASTR